MTRAAPGLSRLMLLFALAALAACGQTGPLYLPDDEAPGAAVEPAAGDAGDGGAPTNPEAVDGASAGAEAVPDDGDEAERRDDAAR